MTRDEIDELLRATVKYKDWWFLIEEDGLSLDGRPRLVLRACFMAIDNDLDGIGVPEEQRSRKWPLSEHMTKTEIIQTAFLAVLKAEEHELREAFKYQGAAIFNSHIGVDELHQVATHADVRVTDATGYK